MDIKGIFIFNRLYCVACYCGANGFEPEYHLYLEVKNKNLLTSKHIEDNPNGVFYCAKCKERINAV